MPHNDIYSFIIHLLKQNNEIVQNVVNIVTKRPKSVAYPFILLHRLENEYTQFSEYLLVRSSLVLDIFTVQHQQCLALIEKVTELLNSYSEIDSAIVGNELSKTLRNIRASTTTILQLRESAIWRSRANIKAHIILRR